MLAKISGVFRLSREPELKYLPSGAELCKLSLVNSNKIKKQDGSTIDESCFIDGVCFSGLAKIANQYLTKGSRIFVNAELKQETWEKDGQKQSRHTLKVDSFEMLDSKPSDNQGQTQAKREPQVVYEQSNIPEIDIDDTDSIPF